MEKEKKIKIKFHTIGINVNFLKESSDRTKLQINNVRELDCHLQYEGKEFNWQTFYDPNNHESLFEFIYRDRMCGVDLLAEPPLLSVKNYPGPFAVVTEVNGRACRLEYYDNDNGALELLQDYRCKYLENVNVPNYVDFPSNSTVEEDLIKIFSRGDINFNK